MSLHEMQRLLQEDLGSTALVSLTPGNLPRLELHIPWCKRTLHWQVRHVVKLASRLFKRTCTCTSRTCMHHAFIIMRCAKLQATGMRA